MRLSLSTAKVAVRLSQQSEPSRTVLGVCDAIQQATQLVHGSKRKQRSPRLNEPSGGRALGDGFEQEALAPDGALRARDVGVPQMLESCHTSLLPLAKLGAKAKTHYLWARDLGFGVRCAVRNHTRRHNLRCDCGGVLTGGRWKLKHLAAEQGPIGVQPVATYSVSRLRTAEVEEWRFLLGTLLNRQKNDSVVRLRVRAQSIRVACLAGGRRRRRRCLHVPCCAVCTSSVPSLRK